MSVDLTARLGSLGVGYQSGVGSLNYGGNTVSYGGGNLTVNGQTPIGAVQQYATQFFQGTLAPRINNAVQSAVTSLENKASSVISKALAHTPLRDVQITTGGITIDQNAANQDQQGDHGQGNSGDVWSPADAAQNGASTPGNYSGPGNQQSLLSIPQEVIQRGAFGLLGLGMILIGFMLLKNQVGNSTLDQDLKRSQLQLNQATLKAQRKPEKSAPVLAVDNTKVSPKRRVQVISGGSGDARPPAKFFQNADSTIEGEGETVVKSGRDNPLAGGNRPHGEPKTLGFGRTKKSRKP